MIREYEAYIGCAKKANEPKVAYLIGYSRERIVSFCSDGGSGSHQHSQLESLGELHITGELLMLSSGVLIVRFLLFYERRWRTRVV